MFSLVKCQHLVTVCAAACLTALVSTAGAATSTMGIDAGQIRVVKGDGIRFDWEDLYISPDEVRASYQFTNTRTEEVVTVVALPLAPIDFEAGLTFATEDRDPRNILGLDLTVNGAKVAADVDVTAVRGGRNITPVLVKHGVPLIPFASVGGRGWEAFFDRIEGLSDAARADLDEVDALSFDEPLWTTQVIYYWTVQFPPNRPVEINYRYEPVPATGLLTRDFLADADTVKRYCLDDGFVAAASARLGPSTANGPGTAVVQTVRHVMTSPDVEPAPIGRFYLTIDAARADTLLSVCASNMVKYGETAVRMERFDHVPSRDIDVLFVRTLDTR